MSERKRCECGCHSGSPGHYHCMGVCRCEHPCKVCYPPPYVLPAIELGFEKITFPTSKKPFPNLDIPSIAGGSTMKKDDDE